jgi:hypothetical protein
MSKVAVLLVRSITGALLRRRIDAVDSEPYWLSPEQYEERDGGVQVIPGRTGDMIEYAKRNQLHPLGIVMVNEVGEYVEYFNPGLILISPRDLDFAEKLFRAHAHHWFCYVPWLASQQPES